jgi:hypothetical protein
MGAAGSSEDENGNPFGTGDTRQTSGPGPKSKSKRSNILGAALLIGMPWLMFVTLILLWTFAYHHFYLLVWIIVLAWGCFSFMFMALDSIKGTSGKPTGSWWLFLGLLCIFAIVNACVCGGYNYWMHMFHYWSFDENRGYTNVLPTEPAEGKQDAGTIVFSNTARVDTTRAVGYRSGTTYCVAPIMDDAQLDRVEYWAAGTNCCEALGDFTCDDTWNPSAKSGVVILDMQPGDAYIMSGESSFGVSLWAPALPYYHKAAKQAEAHFSLTSAKHAIFVRWVADTQVVQDEFWHAGTGFLGIVVLIYLAISIPAGLMLNLWSGSIVQAKGGGPLTPGGTESRGGNEFGTRR